MTTTQDAVAIAGGRWDVLADQYRLDATAYADILLENFFITGNPVIFDGGEVVSIPTVDDEATLTENLPPWKR